MSGPTRQEVEGIFVACRNEPALYDWFEQYDLEAVAFEISDHQSCRVCAVPVLSDNDNADDAVRDRFTLAP